MINYSENNLEWDNLHFSFEDTIFEAGGDDKLLVVAFQTDKEDGLDNVYCFNRNQQIVWRIQHVPDEMGGKMPATYVGVDFTNEKCRVIDFYGRRYEVNKENGNILSRDIVK